MSEDEEIMALIRKMSDGVFRNEKNRGIKKGERKAVLLMKKLIENDCLDDVRMVYENKDYREYLMKKFAVELP